MKVLLVAVCLLITCSAGAGECRTLERVEWILGDWTAQAGDVVVHESWRRVSERTFEGESVSKALAGNDVIDHETLRLVAMSDGIFYLAKVTHNELPVPFRLTECADGLLVFENPLHDAPRRLTYTLVETSDHGEAGLEVRVDGGSMEEFTLLFHRP
jgi:hypothetical protein